MHELRRACTNCQVADAEYTKSRTPNSSLTLLGVAHTSNVERTSDYTQTGSDSCAAGSGKVSPIAAILIGSAPMR